MGFDAEIELFAANKHSLPNCVCFSEFGNRCRSCIVCNEFVIRSQNCVVGSKLTFDAELCVVQ